MRFMLKSKIHRARVTGADINYEGSITIDRKLMQETDILPYEQVHVLDINNGSRLVTYAIEGGEGEICLNGAAARLVSIGDLVIILSYCQVSDEDIPDFEPRLVFVNADNVSMSVGRLAETAPV
ncbi:MAG TPA: aspartate 1-decarboxylase [Dehalococcoidales bacterium]|nr:aspartate 1-decarboxylase [Dehalococcoidales bacterium]